MEVRFSSPSYSASERERLVSVCVDASFKTAVDITVNFTVISETAQGKLNSLEQCLLIIITQKAAIALESLTTHPDEWAEPSHK